MYVVWYDLLDLTINSVVIRLVLVFGCIVMLCFMCLVTVFRCCAVDLVAIWISCVWYYFVVCLVVIVVFVVTFILIILVLLPAFGCLVMTLVVIWG